MSKMNRYFYKQLLVIYTISFSNPILKHYSMIFKVKLRDYVYRFDYNTRSSRENAEILHNYIMCKSG